MMESPVIFITHMQPYHVRTDGVPWQQYFMYNSMGSSGHEIREGSCKLAIQHMTGSFCACRHDAGQGFKYKFKCPSEVNVVNTMLLDEVKKKLYFIHSQNFDSDVAVREATVEIEKMSDGSRTITAIHSGRLFLGRYDSLPNGIFLRWFLNPFDGNIFQVNSVQKFTSSHLVSWIRLDDNIQFIVDHNRYGIQFAGEVKVMSKYKLEFPRLNGLDRDECGILFNDGGKKMLMRFRMGNPDEFDFPDPPPSSKMLPMNALLKRELTHPDSPFTHQMTKPPTYALFGLDYDTHTMQLLTQFIPSSEENHGDLLISTRLLSIYGTSLGFPRDFPRALSFLSQRSHMIGKYLKYTFFSTVHKGAVGIVAVKSLMKTLQNGQHYLSPKKVWFPLEDEKIKREFENLSEKIIKWEMLAQKHNIMLVIGKEFILQVYHPDIKLKAMKQLGSIRIKLGVQYKDYRKCAGCGKIEKHKRRSKNGKRISQFKVCGWCKDHNLHKALEIPCHYCSEECADSHWPIHQLEHNVKEKGAKGKGKKTKGKKKKGKK